MDLKGTVELCLIHGEKNKVGIGIIGDWALKSLIRFLETTPNEERKRTLLQDCCFDITFLVLLDLFFSLVGCLLGVETGCGVSSIGWNGWDGIEWKLEYGPRDTGPGTGDHEPSSKSNIFCCFLSFFFCINRVRILSITIAEVFGSAIALERGGRAGSAWVNLPCRQPRHDIPHHNTRLFLPLIPSQSLKECRSALGLRWEKTSLWSRTRIYYIPRAGTSTRPSLTSHPIPVGVLDTCPVLLERWTWRSRLLTAGSAAPTSTLSTAGGAQQHVSLDSSTKRPSPSSIVLPTL